MSSFKIGDDVIYKGNDVKIVDKYKGGTTNKIELHSGYVPTGIKRKPCTYLLSSGERVKGDKLKKIKQSLTN